MTDAYHDGLGPDDPEPDIHGPDTEEAATMSETTYWRLTKSSAHHLAGVIYGPNVDPKFRASFGDQGEFVEVHPVGTTAELERLRGIEARAREYVDQWAIIEADPQYQNVWFLAANHGMPYTGPRCEDEFNALCAVLGEEGT
jgi:hypothetical protein